MLNRSRALRLGLPLCVLSLGGVGFAVVGGATAATPPLTLSTDLATVPAPPAPTAPNPVAGVETAASDAIPALEALPASPMPDAVAKITAGSQQYGRNPKLARSVDTVYGDGWVVPGRGYVCLVVPDPTGLYATSCLPTAVAAQNGLQISIGGFDPAGKVAVTTVAPAGRAVVARTAAATVSKITATTPGVTTAATDGGAGVSSELVAPDTTVGLSGN